MMPKMFMGAGGAELDLHGLLFDVGGGDGAKEVHGVAQLDLRGLLFDVDCLT